MMNYSVLGNTSHKISRLTFGGAGLSGEGGGYGFGSLSENEAETLVKSAFEAGIHTFDTAPIYGFGLSEIRLGKYLPKDAFIITKGGVDWHENKRVNMTNEPKILEKMLHESLKRLKRDFIDLYMIHWPDPKVEISKSLEVLVRAKEAGKIQFIGLCNTNSHELMKAKEMTRIDLIQSEFNYFSQNHFLEIKDILIKESISFMSWGTFDKGILSGRVHLGRKYENSDARSWAPWWKNQNLKDKLSEVELLREFSKSIGLTLPQLALAWQLIHPEISSSLIGWKNTKDLNESLRDLESINEWHLEKIKEHFKYQ